MYPTSFVFFLAIPLATLAQSIGCGKQAPGYEPSLTFRKFHRIIGGNVAKPHSWPWQVQIRAFDDPTNEDSYYKCGASLIRSSDTTDESDILVTAGHCVVNNGKDYEPNQVKALLGAHDVTEVPSDQIIQVAEIRKHQSYTADLKNDIALIKLATPVKFSDTIRPICLPEQGEVLPVGKQCAAAGWGRVESSNNKQTNVLKQAAVPVHSAETCTQNSRGGWGSNYVEDQMVCAGSLEGLSGICAGDSGGMLACKQEDGSYTLYGASSFGYKGSADIAVCLKPGYPGVFSRISSYVDWIKKEAASMTSVQ